MITFSCTCGKKYQLPDRVAGREVRCNQCGKALIVPETSLPETADQSELHLDTLVKPPLESSTDPTPEHWNNIPEPTGEKNIQSTLVTGLQTRLYQKSISCILTLVLILLGSSISFFVGFITSRMIYFQPPNANQFEANNTDNNPLPVVDEDNSEMKPEQISEAKVDKTVTFADWKIDEKATTIFIAETADKEKIKISLAENPLDTGSKKNTLDELADTLASDSEKQQKKTRHTQSLQIQSENGKEFRIVCPAQGSFDTDAKQIKEIHFSLYMPENANSQFKPVKPEGADKVLVLSTLRVRLVLESGFIEFVPKNIDKFIAICEQAKNNWFSVRIPASGDERWSCNNYGVFGIPIVKRIELYAQPTGSGATFWIDQLEIETP